jgi:heat shock protein HslJ
MRAWGLAIAIVLAGVTASQGGMLGDANKDEVKPLPPMQKNFPLDETFSLRDLNGKPVDSNLDVSFKLDGSYHASGFSGCNSWSATAYPQQNQHIMVGGFAMTKKACDKANQDIERGFLRALQGGPSWDLVNGDLVIKGPGGAIRLARSL